MPEALKLKKLRSNEVLGRLVEIQPHAVLADDRALTHDMPAKRR